MIAIKSIRQDFRPNQEIQHMMETFRNMVNHCIRLGLENNVSTLERFSSLFYHELDQYHIMSYYKYNAMSHACGRLSQMKRCVKKGIKVKSPFVRKPYLTSSYGFKINGMLFSIPTGRREKFLIQLNTHTVSKLSDKDVRPRSFTITPNSLSISVRKEVHPIRPENVIGIDRNLRNITISTIENTVMYKTGKLLSISENSRYVGASIKRNDRRIKGMFFTCRKNRQSRRTQQHLHKISKDIVQRAKETKSIIVFENLTGIRKLYRKGNRQGRKYRRRMNSWPFYQLLFQVSYKAAWEGIQVEFIDPKRTSQLCPICGEQIQADRFQLRKLWCTNCTRSMDRDVVAALNISYKGWSRFCHPRGLPDEVMKRNVDNLEPLILRVDGSKLQIQDVDNRTILQ